MSKFLQKINATKKSNIYPRFGIYGGPGSGKSTFGLTFPKPFVMNIERGASSLQRIGAFNRETGEVLPWVNEPGTFYSKEYVDPGDIIADLRMMHEDGVLAGREPEIQTIVIDSITVFKELVSRSYKHFSGKIKIDVESEKELFSKDDMTMYDYMNVRTPLQELLHYTNISKINFVFIAHIGANILKEEYKDRSGRTRSKMKFVGSKGKAMDSYNLDVELEIIDESHPEYEKDKVKALVRKDRTQVFSVNDIVVNPRYQLWEEAIVNPEKFRQRKLDTLRPTENRPNIEAKINFALKDPNLLSLAEAKGINQPTLVGLLRKYNGDLEFVVNKLKEI